MRSPTPDGGLAADRRFYAGRGLGNINLWGPNRDWGRRLQRAGRGQRFDTTEWEVPQTAAGITNRMPICDEKDRKDDKGPKKSVDQVEHSYLWDDRAAPRVGSWA